MVIKRSSEMAKEIKIDMRGGTGDIEITHLLNKNEFEGKSRLLAKIKIDVGCSIGLHEHINEEELYYIINGNGLLDDNGEKIEVGPGDSILTKSGESHALKNIGEESIEMLAVILTYS